MFIDYSQLGLNYKLTAAQVSCFAIKCLAFIISVSIMSAHARDHADPVQYLVMLRSFERNVQSHGAAGGSQETIFGSL